MDFNLPKVLRHFYREWSQDITFVIMLREPLARMQSAWYYFRRYVDKTGVDVCDSWLPGCNESSFQDAVAGSVSAARSSSPSYSMLLWQSMYARHLEGYLAEFEAAQFVIVPFLHYVKFNPHAACAALNRRLNVDMNCQNFTPSRENVHAHPPLASSLSA